MERSGCAILKPSRRRPDPTARRVRRPGRGPPAGEGRRRPGRGVAARRRRPCHPPPDAFGAGDRPGPCGARRVLHGALAGRRGGGRRSGTARPRSRPGEPYGEKETVSGISVMPLYLSIAAFMRFSLCPSRLFHSAPPVEEVLEGGVRLRTDPEVAGQGGARLRVVEGAEPGVLLLGDHAREDRGGERVGAPGRDGEDDLGELLELYLARLRSPFLQEELVGGARHDRHLHARVVVVGPVVALEARPVHGDPFDPVDRPREVDGGGPDRGGLHPGREVDLAGRDREHQLAPSADLDHVEIDLHLLGDVLRHLDEGPAPFVGRLVLDEVGRVVEHGELELSVAPRPLPGGFRLGDARCAEEYRRSERDRRQPAEKFLHGVAPSAPIRLAGSSLPHGRGPGGGVAALTDGEPAFEQSGGDVASAACRHEGASSSEPA